MRKALAPIEEVRNPMTYDREAVSNATGLSCPEPTLTKQEFAEESDINYIAMRYGLTGEMPQVLNLPTYGDFTGIFDFQSAQEAVIQARMQFMELPAKIRERFDNDPQKLLAFMDRASRDEEAEKEAIFLGLATPKEVPQSRVDAPAAPDRANPAPDPDKPSERSTTKAKGDKKDT